MASLIDIRRRLRSVKSTQQITKAMKMVAAAKLRRAQERVIGARPYAKQVARALASVMGRSGGLAHPLLEAREEKRVVVVVVAGDRGLCGAFNTNVHRSTAHLLAARPEWEEVRILPVGKKAVEFWRRRPYPFTEKTYSGIFGSLTYAHAREIAAFLSGEKVDDPLAMYLNDIYTVTADLAGIPGISIPCGETKEKLPIGMQILGKHFDESTILRVANAYEKAG